ncbi:Smr/MutS family protein [Igneacidithiobacillus siniensis]|uniref:Smr/MutS family protein n=1 Tax=Acidithiobacillus TaxID=119977 RepID=UPI00201085A3
MPQRRKHSQQQGPLGPLLGEEERAEFRAAVGDVHPLAAPAPPSRPPPPRPVAQSTLADDLAVLADLARGHEEESDWWTGDEWIYLRPGLPERRLRDLRRGKIRIQADLDLHGLRADEARAAVGGFLLEARRQRWTCVRIVHGKGYGSPGQVPVLKRLVGHWLQRHREVLAFAPARPTEGGSGALRVLLGEPRD